MFVWATHLNLEYLYSGALRLWGSQSLFMSILKRCWRPPQQVRTPSLCLGQNKAAVSKTIIALQKTVGIRFCSIHLGDLGHLTQCDHRERSNGAELFWFWSRRSSSDWAAMTTNMKNICCQLPTFNSQVLAGDFEIISCTLGWRWTLLAFALGLTRFVW